MPSEILAAVRIGRTQTTLSVRFCLSFQEKVYMNFLLIVRFCDFVCYIYIYVFLRIKVCLKQRGSTLHVQGA